MKVLHVLPNLQMGGAEKLLVDSIPIYIKEIDKVDVLLLDGQDSPLRRRLNSYGCHVFSIGSNPYALLSVFKIMPYIKKYDIVHVHLFPCLYILALVRILTQTTIPFVYTEHSTHNKRRDKKYLYLLEKIVYKQYKKIIAISEYTKINLLKWIGDNNGAKVEVIENGVDTVVYKNALPIDKSKFSISGTAKIILMVARFSKQKDHATLIKAFSELSDKSTFLLLAGDGPLKKDLQNLSVTLGVQSRVRFLGIREDIPSLIKTADICILSSNWEGFGLVAAEYMAAGKPVIVSNVPGLSNVVGNAGLIFEKGNTEDLKNKIECLLSDNSLYSVIAEKSKKRSLEFGIDKMVNSYIKLYRNICQ